MNPGGAYEKRWRELGHARFTLRLKSQAMEALDELCRQHNCNRRDAIEGLLLGNIGSTAWAVMRTHRFSEIEARDFADQFGPRGT